MLSLRIAFLFPRFPAHIHTTGFGHLSLLHTEHAVLYSTGFGRLQGCTALLVVLSLSRAGARGLHTFGREHHGILHAGMLTATSRFDPTNTIYKYMHRLHGDVIRLSSEPPSPRTIWTLSDELLVRAVLRYTVVVGVPCPEGHLGYSTKEIRVFLRIVDSVSRQR